MATLSPDKPPRTPRARADIETDLAALRADVAALAESLRAYGHARANDMTDPARARADDLAGAAGEAAQDLRRQVDALEKELESTVRDHPVQALLAAFGLGFVLSLLLRR